MPNTDQISQVQQRRSIIGAVVRCSVVWSPPTEDHTDEKLDKPPAPLYNGKIIYLFFSDFCLTDALFTALVSLVQAGHC